MKSHRHRHPSRKEEYDNFLSKSQACSVLCTQDRDTTNALNFNKSAYAHLKVLKKSLQSIRQEASSVVGHCSIEQQT